MTTVALSLVSHTNVGKTTLARTLLGRDIGEVRDEAHVTQQAEPYALVETPQGDRLDLWDTPGFGDSVRLARRLEQAGNPIGWFLSEVWDRVRDRAFWSSQRALRHVLERADVVLYLVNASESPEAVPYLDAELRVLSLIGKPVIVLLNQLGPPRVALEEAAELQRWHDRVAGAPCVRALLPLDAFARCWVQEGALLHAVAGLLPGELAVAYERLHAAWQARRVEVWRQSMALLTARLARAALDLQEVRDAGWSGKLREMGAAFGLRHDATLPPRQQAMQDLAQRLDNDIRASTEQLIRLHGLDGRAAELVLTRLAEHYAVTEPVSEGKAAVWGAAVTGALAGLKADIATGGLTLGGGLLAGGVLGALGALGLAKGYNALQGTEKPTVVWSDGVLDGLLESSLLGYLAVVHFGRGRGEWAESEHPAHWVDVVRQVVAARRPALAGLWARRRVLQTDSVGREAFASVLNALLLEISEDLLGRLYPKAPRFAVTPPAV